MFIKRLMHTMTPFRQNYSKNFVGKIIKNRIHKSLIIIKRTDNILNLENTKLSLKSHTMPLLSGRNGHVVGKHRKNQQILFQGELQIQIILVLRITSYRIKSRKYTFKLLKQKKTKENPYLKKEIGRKHNSNTTEVKPSDAIKCE